MTRKERTIRACKKLSYKYRNPEGQVFINIDACPLCAIHAIDLSVVGVTCRGCPLANAVGECGCIRFKSIPDESGINYDSYCYDAVYQTHLRKKFEKRAKFFDKIVPILEKLPRERFTKKGWKYTDDVISRDW